MNSVGVPQGSSLSAMLFSLYINNINDPAMFCKSMLYADDMQLYILYNVLDVMQYYYYFYYYAVNAYCELNDEWTLERALNMMVVLHDIKQSCQCYR